MDADDARLGGHRPSALPLDRSLLMGTPSGEPALVCGTVAPATALPR